LNLIKSHTHVHTRTHTRAHTLYFVQMEELEIVDYRPRPSKIDKFKISACSCIISFCILTVFYSIIVTYILIMLHKTGGFDITSIFGTNETPAYIQNHTHNLHSGVKMKIYATPGIYTLNPSDYNHVDNIIIELWGAGGAGSTCRYDVNSNNMMGIGGGSGGYIKASITTNQNSFTLYIGEGATSTNMIYSCLPSSYDSKGTTYLEINNDFMFSAGGGGTCGNITEYPFSNEGKNYIAYGIKNVLSFDGESGLYNTIPGGSGGYAPYGGAGGKIGYLKINNNNVYQGKNGDTPGGGGAGIGLRYITSTTSTQYLKINGDGANGGAIIYF